MAGEWVAIDLAIETKPEVLRLTTRTGVPIESVIYRLWKMWGWFSLNSEDGTASVTPELLALVCGGDAAWWRAVEAVGWIAFDDATERATLPGWNERFSKAAKARLLNARRQAAYRQKTDEIPEDSCRNASVTQDRYATVTHRNGPATLNRGEEIEDSSSSSARDANEPEDEAARWSTLLAAWNAGPGQPWKSPRKPVEARERLQGRRGGEWLVIALQAIPALSGCRYFSTPVSLTQFCGDDGFADRVLGGAYAERSAAGKRGGIGQPQDKPPPREWAGDDAAAFERTKQKLAQQLRAASA